MAVIASGDRGLLRSRAGPRIGEPSRHRVIGVVDRSFGAGDARGLAGDRVVGVGGGADRRGHVAVGVLRRALLPAEAVVAVDCLLFGGRVLFESLVLSPKHIKT